MKIYFAGSITGNNESKELFFGIMNHIKKFGEITDENAGWNGEDFGNMSLKEIHNRDIKWLDEAEILIAEVTKKSLGVGYEIGRALEQKKPVLCLFNKNSDKELSRIIAGCPDITNKSYTNLEEAKQAIDEFIKTF
jgi:nucleoside 2-deoxyribosyltransferase